MDDRTGSNRSETRQPRHAPVPPNEARPNTNRRQSNRGRHQSSSVNHPQRQGGHQASKWRNNPTQTHQNQTSGNAQQQRRTDRHIHIGFQKLEEWSNMEPDSILVELIGGKTGFEGLLESDLSGDKVVLVAKILAKLCLSPFKENKIEIMNLVSKENFLYNLKSYVMQLQLQQRHERKEHKLFWEDVDGFFANLITMFESVVEGLPTKACEILPKMLRAITVTVPNFEAEHNVEISSEIKQNFEKVQRKVNLCRSELERKKQNVQQYEEKAPLDNFRELSVYPTVQEILTNYRPFVRKHIIEGAYTNVDHYLDVQFRLLKEDFVAPLREAVCEYMRQAQTKRYISKISNVRIHQAVKFQRPSFNKNKGQVGVLVQLPDKTKNYQNCKWFMYGSLVCFTKDNFSSIIFGRILEKDADEKSPQKDQAIVIGFEEGYENNYELNQPYLMVECSVYFEPYYHVLKALQNMHEDGFPMKNYLIDVNPNIEPPNYLNPESTYHIKNNPVSLFTPDSWPTALDLDLDDTQHAAFKAALTQKFAVIQGPPGTGKTYLGLEVAKTLIRNGNCWYNRTPILVVCFTNHALDQFLEGLLSTTSEIVRVGGQSKNEKLEKFNLREKRKNSNGKLEMQLAIRSLRDELGDVLNNIKECSECFDETQTGEGVIEFKWFSNINPEYQKSWFATASNNEIVAWLFEGRIRQPQNQKMQEGRVEEEVKNSEDDLNRESTLKLDAVLQGAHRLQNTTDEDGELAEMCSKAPRKSEYLVSVSQLEENVKKIQHKLGNQIREIDDHNFKRKLERQLFEAEDDLEYLKMNLNKGKHYGVLIRKPAKLDLVNPNNMAADDRWALYFSWLHQYRTCLTNELVALHTKYHEKSKQYREIKSIADAEVMKQMLVVGMTTTSAARLQTTLQALQSRIVIVEEAAEVLESHIIVSLTNHCEHLILIGDHQQLRPSTANFRMERYFNLGISLFERMVRNKIQCHVLRVQHRMRPEIAKLIVPNIYPVLEDHPSVCNFPPILGMDQCMYFIDHDHPEQESGDSSKLNKHEAKFLIRLARYLIQNGYQSADITILAAYSGQMFALWKERQQNPALLEDVRITVLDNYQGEESKIILLSLVRNNVDDKIGFLKIENRVCVALSRAKEGFYIMGNMGLLCRNSEIWPKVKISLESQDCLGKSLALRCQFHKEEVTRVTSAEDFDQVPEGGCSKVCGFDLKCGHKCNQICHMTDRVHATVVCKASCTRILCENNHHCPKQCYEECGKCVVLMRRTLTCGHEKVLKCYKDPDEYSCRIPVTVKLSCEHEHVIECHINPNDYKCETPIPAELPCGHVVANKPCYQNLECYKCPFPCDTTVDPCGHACTMKCHINEDPDHLEYRCYKPCVKIREGCSTGEHVCPKPCFEECPPCLVVLKKCRTVCSHYLDVACNVNVDEADCPKPCRNQLPCGHPCKQRCFEQCGNCQYMVEKVVPGCNHVVKLKCCEVPSRKMCRGQCPEKLSCGHLCRNKCNEPCTTKCKELVEHTKPADCGHKFEISCYMLPEELPSNSERLLKFCHEPCGVLLACNHLCSGTCSGCVQGRFHETCKEKCGVFFICGHQCPLPCHEPCQPCNQSCSYRCQHSVCKNKCGEPCISCKENCGRRCKHATCTRKCGNMCTIPPCIEPYEKLLQCGHPCVGFCGDPCPPFCKKCDHKELFLGLRDEEDVRFVLLDECKHVVESKEMEKWLQEVVGITHKSCPKCMTLLVTTRRYSDYIKRANRDIATVKNKCRGNLKENEKIRFELLRRLKGLYANSEPLIFYSPETRRLLEDLKTAMSPGRNKTRVPLSTVLVETCTAKIQILENLFAAFREAKLKNPNVVAKATGHMKFILKLVLHWGQQFTKQEINDIQRELKRFERIVQLCQIEDCDKLPSVVASKPHVKALLEEANKLTTSANPYTDATDAFLECSKLVPLSKEIESGIAIRKRESQEIVKAKAMKAESWFKCPNGHIYYVDDYCGAAEIPKCTPCSTANFDQKHALLPGRNG